jgi:hypothetical protein
LPDVIYASDAEFAEFAKLAEMSAFDSGKDRLIRQRLVALAHGQELDPDEMSKEETALRHSAERYGKGELPGDPPPES